MLLLHFVCSLHIPVRHCSSLGRAHLSLVLACHKRAHWPRLVFESVGTSLTTVPAHLHARETWSRRNAMQLGLLLATNVGVATAAVPSGNLEASKEKEMKMLESIAYYYRSNGMKIPEFWPGWLQGRSPPTPDVFLQNAPPIVILPGFGNDASDYVTPKGLPQEVGMAAALTRRGVSAVDVVPVARSDWFNVAKGLLDINFLQGNAQLEGSAFSWYIKLAKASVEKAVVARRAAQEETGDARVILLGHSAGGWLARALCATEGDSWTKQNVRGIVTLGAPHASPPPGVLDQTRGTLTNVNERQPGAYYSRRDVFYVTVSSDRVIGDESGDALSRDAAGAYKLVIGRGQGIKGDGVVPMDAANLDGATQIVVGCFHAPSSGTRGAEWYGAEAYIDSWLRAVSLQLEAQERDRKG